MGRAAWLAALCVAIWGPWAAARGDVVHLTNGRTLSGEVIHADDQEVVIRTPQGKVTLPRRLVSKVERTSADATLLELAKERLAGGARTEAEALLRKAAASSDPAVAAQAKARLAELEAKAESAARRKDEPRTPFPLPGDVSGTPSEGATLQVQLDRARRALDYRDGLRARALLEPLVSQNPAQAQLRYALGRALALSGEAEAARAAYEASLGRAARRLSERPFEWVEDLARRGAAGEELGPNAPGGSARWHRVAGVEVAIYSLHELDPRLARRLDALATAARRTFDLRARESDLDGRIQLCLGLNRRELKDLGEAPAPRALTIDGVLWRHRLLASELSSSAPGILSRAILERAVPGTPGWATAGAAARLGSDEERAAALAAARARYGAQPPPLLGFLDGDPGAPEGGEEALAYEGLCALVFDLVVARRDDELRKALNFASKIERLGGAGKALERFRVDAAELEAAYLEALVR